MMDCLLRFFAYGISVWGSTFTTYIDPIFILQKKVLKIITFNKVIDLSRISFETEAKVYFPSACI